MTCQELAKQALYQLKALQDLTTATGTITNRAQRELLRSLSPDVMILVATELSRTNNQILKTTQETDNGNHR